MPSPPDPLRLFLVASIVQLLAALAAIAIARARVEHRPVAAFLAFQVVANALHEAIRVLVLVPAHAASDGPLTGGARVLGHVATALGLTWPAGLAAVALVVLAHQRPLRAIAGLWAAVSVLLALTYPASRGGLLARELAACEVAAFVAGGYAAVVWLRRRWADPDGEPRHIEHLVALWLVVTELGLLIVVWRENVFGSWAGADFALVIVYGTIAVFQGGVLWSGSHRSS